jgi:hypothetical protein
MPIFNIGSGGGGAASVPDATTTTAGKVRLATVAEANAGTSELIAVTPAGLQDAIGGIVGGMEFKGAYDIGIGVPDLSDAIKGDYYVVTNVRTNPSDTNDTKELYGQEWAVGDHLVITEDMGGTVDNAKITKVDNSESISVLGDLLDVALSAEAASHVLVYEDVSGEWQNRQLSVDDLLDVASQTDLTALTLRVDTAESDITTLQSDLSTEATARANADSTLQTNINNEATARANADSTLQTNINNEATTRANADSTLQSELDATQGGAGLEANGTYTANVSTNYLTTATSLKGADEALDAKLKETRDLVDTLGSNSVSSVNGETPVAGDVTLGGVHIDTAHSAVNYTAAGADLDSHLAGIDGALLAESTARADADTTLQSNIDAEATARGHADTALQSELDATQAGAGLEADGSYVANGSANYISAVASLKGADEALDSKLKETRDLVDNLGANSVASVNGVSPVAGDVTLGGVHIDTAHSAVNYTATGADLDSHLAGVDSALALKANSADLGAVATSNAYSDLDGLPTLGTAASKDAGSAVGEVVLLGDVGGNAALPAVDGSQLTGITVDLSSGSVGDLGDVTLTTPAEGDALVLNATGDFVNTALATVATSGSYNDLSNTPTLATVATSGSYNDLSNTPTLATVATSGSYNDLSNTPTLGTASALDVGTGALNVVQLDATSKLPAVDGSQLTNITADVTNSPLGDLSDVTITSAANGDALVYNGTAWVDTALAAVATSGSAGDLAGLAAVATSGSYSDLSNTPTLGTAAALDVGTSANNVVQLDGTGALPAVDGSALTGVTVDLSTGSLADLGDVTITSATSGDALVHNGTAWVDTALATVATSGDFADLINAPTSTINGASFVTDTDALTLVAGTHYIISTATSSTKTLTLPSVSSDGDYIRITNWGLGDLVVQVDQVSADAYLLVGQTITRNGSVTIESKATVDLFGFSYSQGGTTYDPAWGVYFSSSIELNTKSFNTTGQLPYYDATAQELKAGDLGNLTFSFAPSNYDNTRGGTVTGDAVGDHFGGVDDALGLKANSADLADIATSGASEDASVALTATEYTAATQDVEAHLTGINTRLIDLVESVNSVTVTAGTHDVVLGGANIDTAHTASDYTAAASDLDSHIAGIDARLAEKANKADGLNGLDDVDLTVAPTDGQILLFDGVSSTFKAGPPPAPVADTDTLGLVELATDAEAQAATATDRALTPSNLVALDLDTFADVVYPSAPTDGQILKWIDANSRWEPAELVPSAPKVTSDTPASTYSITTHDGIEEIYLLTPSVDCTVSIPTAADAGSGFKYFIKNLSTNVLTINATIDGQASFDLSNQYSAVGIVSDGTNWFIF